MYLFPRLLFQIRVKMSPVVQTPTACCSTTSPPVCAAMDTQGNLELKGVAPILTSAQPIHALQVPFAIMKLDHFHASAPVEQPVIRTAVAARSPTYLTSVDQVPRVPSENNASRTSSLVAVSAYVKEATLETVKLESAETLTSVWSTEINLLVVSTQFVKISREVMNASVHLDSTETHLLSVKVRPLM